MKLLNFRLLLAWTLSLPVSFFTVGFLSNFYSTPVEIVLLAVFCHLAAGAFFHLLIGKANHIPRWELLIAFALFIVLSAFVVLMFQMAAQYPSLFDAAYFYVETDQLIFFAPGALLALPGLVWMLSVARRKQFEQTGIFQFLDSNLSGIFLAGFFFAVSLIAASIFNRPVFDVDDIFFDSDGLLWRMRFTTVEWRDYYWRAVHPFVLLIIRPVIAMMVVFLKGDRLSAAFVLVALAAALCVFLAWFFVKRMTGNPLYALLIASLLGASAAHLVFGALIETYILLAAVMMAFLVLLLKDKPLHVLVVIGLVSFGITITNFIQTAIAFIFVKRDFKEWIKYGLVVGALVIPLTLLNNLVYPDSQPYFFIPSNFSAETDNTFAPTVQRAQAIVRVMFLHSIVAPDPLILEEEIPFLKVWIFKADPMRLSEYGTLLGRGLVIFWLVLSLPGGLLFLKNLKKEDNRFSFAFTLVILFNFALHLRYGKDIFLYSTNWTYAIVLFLALAWKELSGGKWFHIVLLVFISLLLANNSSLIHTMLSTSALHIK